VAAASTSDPVALHVFHFIDRSRMMSLPDGRMVARPVTTYVHVPSGAGPWPLIVFGHGYAATPGIYARLLRSWALAGYVVAAPLFPRGNEHAAGGPDESDIVNQPGDMSFVISALLRANGTRRSALYGQIDPARIGVAGQSDGAETAFAVAYDQGFRDSRIDAAVVLSGAQIPGLPFRFSPRSPALLAVQGTSDTTNRPRFTKMLYDAAPPPKFLLRLPGAGHLGPYTTEEPQLGVVERVTEAFFNRYLKSGSLEAITAAATAPGIATLTMAPTR
jgi:dienelactone hydrolase